MKRPHLPAILVIATTVAAAVAHAADAAAPVAPAAPPAAETLVSPEVEADRKVTFRLRAPKATEVTVAGEWTRAGGKPNDPQKLTRAADGVWSVTLGPLDPNVYIYVFNVDGMTITDPVNPLIKLRARTSASMVEVPAGAPWEFRDVPHGALTTETHAARTLGGQSRQVVVYTPPSYDKDRRARFPVLYLLHGNNDLAVGWTMAGKANLILDNLIADGKVAPMIVVMPWGHALPFGARPPAGQPSNNDVFERYLVEEVVPLVEGKYRVWSGARARKSRAVMGLSMGGAQALQLALRHRELFGNLGVFGSGMTRADFDARYGEVLGKAKGDFTVVYVGAGTLDGVRPRAKELADTLTTHGLPVTYRETEGGHTYPTWRQLLVDAAPLLFRK